MTFPASLLDNLAAESIRADSLDLALKSALFDQLVHPQSAGSLAAALDWHPEPTAHLLELLWSMQLLTRERIASAIHYRTTDEVQPWLCRKGARYRGDAWCFRLHSLRGFGQQLPAMLRQPLPGFSEQLAQDAAWAAAADGQIAEEQRSLTVDTACALAATLPQFTRPARLLDMGGGPGLVSIALALRHPQLSGVVQDLPLTAAVAQKHLDAAGVGDRFHAVSELPPTARFDVIWCSSFLHFVADPAQTLSELYQRLHPGGVLISAHARLGEDPQQVRRVAPFFMPLMMRGKAVFHHDSLAQMLRTAGFRVEDQGEHPFPMAPLHVHFAFRPSA